VGVNLQDYESGYTALHRALFAGNIRAARDLLMRHDIDISIKDAEGLTAFDLYNGTVEGVSLGTLGCHRRANSRQIPLGTLKALTCSIGVSTVSIGLDRHFPSY